MMNPLCTLRYSATHADKFHMVYRLNAVDAYERKLVKQIEVAAGVVANDHNRPYVPPGGHAPAAGDHLGRSRGGRGDAGRRRAAPHSEGGRWRRVGAEDAPRAVYRDHRIGEIRVQRGNEYLELRLPGDEHWMRPGDIHGGVDPVTVHREMMRKTIREHLDKEIRLRQQGIKVLTLFFIDKVAHYRRYDDEGNPVKGEYARIFEDEYRRAANRPEYRVLFDGVDVQEAAESVHEGYFSIDRQGGWTDTAENNQTHRDNAERAYRLIMRDKEKLLGFEEPLQFIFSHSALREGWDNPNVFPDLRPAGHIDGAGAPADHRPGVAPLRQPDRRTAAWVRGEHLDPSSPVRATRSSLRTCNGRSRRKRVSGSAWWNGIRSHPSSSKTRTAKPGLSASSSRSGFGTIWSRKATWTARGKPWIRCRKRLTVTGVVLPDEFEPLREAVTQALRRFTTRIKIRKADERRHVKPREAVLDGAEFQALWGSHQAQDDLSSPLRQRGDARILLAGA